MEATTCRHKEHISNVESGIDEGVCSVCRQARRYYWRDGKGKGEKSRRVSKIVKLGRVNGKIVLPGPKDIVDLSPEETAELRAATPAHNPNNPETDDDHLPPVPPRPKNRMAAHRYWEEHKDEVLADLARLGYRATLERWKLSPGVLTKLRGTRGKGKRTKASTSPEDKPGVTRKSEKVNEGANKLPPFPAFNNSWPFLVQEKWLTSYVELRRLELAGK